MYCFNFFRNQLWRYLISYNSFRTVNMCLLEVAMCEKCRSSHFQWEEGGNKKFEDWGRGLKNFRTGGLPLHAMDKWLLWKECRSAKLQNYFKRILLQIFCFKFLKFFRACVFHKSSRCVLNPSLPDSGQREKIDLNFYLQTSLWCLKIFYVGLKGILIQL